MNAVTNMAPAASSNATLARQVVPGQTSAATDQTSSAQPFTDVLSEQTSKTSRNTSDKGESTNDLTPSSQGRPASSSKKIVVADASTLVVPLAVPVVPADMTNAAPVAAGVTADMTNAAPVAAVTTVHSVIEVLPGTTQATVAATIDVGKEDVKSPISLLEVGTSRHPDLGHSDLVQTDLSRAVSTQGVALGTPAVKMVAVGENAGHVGAQDRPAPLNSTMGSTNSTRDQAMTHVSWPSGSDDVAKVTSEVHASQPMPTGLEVDARPEHLRDGSVRVTSRLAEPVSEPASSPLAHSQFLDTPVLPASPTSALVSGTGVFGADVTARPAQSMPHSLDVGELVGAISRPLSEGREGYTVLIAMRPADLGQLQAVVTLHGNDLQVSITPQTHVGHDALANAVDTLKEKLSHGGVNVNVTLHDPGSQSRGDDRPATTAVRGEAFLSDESVTMSSPLPVLTASQIHLVL